MVIKIFLTPSIHQVTHLALLLFFSEKFKLPLLFSGDTLFQRSIGRTDLPGGDPNLIIKSTKNRLLTLHEETNVIPGHGPLTQIYTEKDLTHLSLKGDLYAQPRTHRNHYCSISCSFTFWKQKTSDLGGALGKSLKNFKAGMRKDNEEK